MTRLVREVASLRRTFDGAGTIGVVMTMGALHDGHAALMRAARARVGPDGVVVVTVFVNPLQFGPGEDFERYPRTLETDLLVCRSEGVDVVFAPGAAEVYPREPEVRVQAGPLGSVLEGASRPGHFDGMLTVVLKLLHLVGPQVAFFGEKDYQQLQLVRAMVLDLSVPVDIVGVATVREADGLAMSSRNRYLSEPERKAALALRQALLSGAAAARAGGEHVCAAAQHVLDAEPGVTVDYLALTAADLGPPRPGEQGRLLVAARVGSTRLIDNSAVQICAVAKEV